MTNAWSIDKMSILLYFIERKSALSLIKDKWSAGLLISALLQEEKTMQIYKTTITKPTENEACIVKSETFIVLHVSGKM